MILTRLAWRNLWRRRRRTLITASSIAFGVMLAVTFIAISDYSHVNLINTSATMGFGHLTVEPVGYNDSPTPDKRLSEAEEVRTRALEFPGVRTAIVRVFGQAMFATAANSTGGTFLGIDPAQETSEYNLFLDSMVEGRLFEQAGDSGAVVGARMAEKLKLSPGKKLVFTTTDSRDEIVSEMVRVTGIFRTGSSDIDGYIVLLPIDTVRAALHYSPDEATLVTVILEDYREADSLQAAIGAAVADSKRAVLTWRETQPEMAGLVTIDRRMHLLLQFLVALLIAAGILNTVLMSVLERVREFGIMLAVGLSPRALFRLVLLESFWIGVAGITLGAVVTTPWFIYMSRTGIDLSGLLGSDYSAGGVLMEPVIKFRLFKESLFIIIGEVFVLTLLAGLYPAIRAGRLLPVESIRKI